MNTQANIAMQRPRARANSAGAVTQSYERRAECPDRSALHRPRGPSGRGTDQVLFAGAARLEIETTSRGRRGSSPHVADSSILVRVSGASRHHSVGRTLRRVAWRPSRQRPTRQQRQRAIDAFATKLGQTHPRANRAFGSGMRYTISKKNMSAVSASSQQNASIWSPRRAAMAQRRPLPRRTSASTTTSGFAAQRKPRNCSSETVR